ncbi:hypothetical protein [Candidatus Parabeggiatoa sp. HSG14]|uniref:hypothetical protein n=1 Tax=Candidatus Parabeggiatoa sp. HSG14 TaxID=3055593 RepID=UPI0025A727C8|nr:hypothetical protein [Thiotrichales bacterium HSG14]
MDKIISPLIIGYLLSMPLTVPGCTEIPKTAELRRDWIPTNLQLLKQPIDLKNCLNKKHIMVSKKSTVKGIGVILHPNLTSIRTQSWEQLLDENATHLKQGLKQTEVKISIVPYIINEKNQKIMMMPRLPTAEFNKFLPACTPGFKGFSETILKMPYFYPTVTLKVAKEQRYNLVNYLKEQRNKDCWFGNFTEESVNPTKPYHSRPIGVLVKQIFEKKQAMFLRGFPYTTNVKLAETTVKFSIKHNALVKKQLTSKSDAHTVQVKLVWPKKLGKLMVTGCGEAQGINQGYASICSFVDGNTYHIKKPPKPNAQITLKWPKELGKLDVSSCEEPTESGENYSAICSFTTDEIYRITPADIFLSKKQDNKLIVVSLSVNFDSQGMGKVIQESLYNVFKEMKEVNPSFILVAIGSGRQLTNPILSSEELPTLSVDNTSDTLKEKMRQLQFSATDLNALDDLELVDSYMSYQSEQIKQVLYLTDNMGLSEHPPRKQLGVPLSWYREGIELTVLTTERCTFWEEGVDAHCVEWKDKEGLEEGLNAFFEK